MELNRVPAGRINGVFAAPGTILGPKAVTREFVVATSADTGSSLGASNEDNPFVLVGYATQEDLLGIIDRGDPRSVTEFIILRDTDPQVATLRSLFGAG